MSGRSLVLFIVLGVIALLTRDIVVIVIIASLVAVGAGTRLTREGKNNDS